ncbi:MAG: Ig-like domain-containing protein [Dysgonamonadaceae bacterium]|jgi:hypothetical protein|nr:Ig-like domain-containing protein [Dysgonamonadaceae bacterium]
MKTRFLFSAMFVFLVIIFTSCEKDIPITDITFQKEVSAIKMGETLTLNTRVFPADANNQRLKWSSSDISIATVNENGEVTALKKGTVQIIVATNDGRQMATCTLIVVDEPNIVMSYSVDSPINVYPQLSFSLISTSDIEMIVMDIGDGLEVVSLTDGLLRFGNQYYPLEVMPPRIVKIYCEHVTELRARENHNYCYQITDLDISNATNLEKLFLEGRLTNLGVSGTERLSLIDLINNRIFSVQALNDLIGTLDYNSYISKREILVSINGKEDYDNVDFSTAEDRGWSVVTYVKWENRWW